MEIYVMAAYAGRERVEVGAVYEIPSANTAKEACGLLKTEFGWARIEYLVPPVPGIPVPADAPRVRLG